MHVLYHDHADPSAAPSSGPACMTAGTSVDAARRGEQGVGDGAVQPGDGDRAVEGRRGRVGLGRGQRRDQASRHGGRLRREHVRQVGADRERGPQQVGGQYERKRSLAVVTAGRQHCGTGLGHLLAEFGDKPGLAAAGLAGDRHHPPVPPGGLPGRAQGGQLDLPAHQRPGHRGRRTAVVGFAAGPRRRRFKPARAHLVVELCRLGQRPDGEIPIEHPHQCPVLPHGGRPLAGPA